MNSTLRDIPQVRPNDMAALPGVPRAGTSRLERLPGELLEKILLDVVKDTPPPETKDAAGHSHLRCECEHSKKTLSASKLLMLRLVSRTIRARS